MRGISRRLLAQDRAGRIEDGACAGRGPEWDALEEAHRTARRGRAAELVTSVINDWCGDCPALDACHLWARDQGYTGLAAGAPYRDGKRMPLDWVMPRNGRGAKPKASSSSEQPSTESQPGPARGAAANSDATVSTGPGAGPGVDLGEVAPEAKAS